ncbi:MAG: transposase, partial [Leptolyngbyaceae cyanobacterium SL_1_1]|nr:transposase [Leptolyngbyaceae cyanobacterium RM1_1_2]NJO11124.1 transposase [Leptolyngbyaceae cyanobacterium SL_1_1]
GLGLEDLVPDAMTLWLFRDQLQQHGLVEALFEQFGEVLQGAGYSAKDGQIVDATLIPVPKQRNTRDERNRPLTEEQKTANRERSKTRARVEHIFGDFVTSIGLARAQTQLGLKNLVYNLKRFVYLESQSTALAKVAG